MSLYDEYQKQQNKQTTSLYQQFLKSTVKNTPATTTSANGFPAESIVTPSQLAAQNNKQSALDQIGGFASNIIKSGADAIGSLFSKFQASTKTPTPIQLNQDQINKIDNNAKSNKPVVNLVKETSVAPSAQPTADYYESPQYRATTNLIDSFYKNPIDTVIFNPAQNFLDSHPEAKQTFMNVGNALFDNPVTKQPLVQDTLQSIARNLFNSSDYARTTLDTALAKDVTTGDKVSRTIGDVVGTLTTYLAGGEVLGSMKFGKATLPVLFATLGQTSTPSTATSGQRLTKGMIDAMSGILLNYIKVPSKLLDVKQLSALAKSLGILSTQTFGDVKALGGTNEQATEAVKQTVITAALLHTTFMATGKIGTKLTESQTKEGQIELTPQQAEANVKGSNLNETALGNEILKKAQQAQTEGKNISISGVATKKSPVASALNLKTPEGVAVNIDIVEPTNPIQLLSDSSQPTTDQTSGTIADIANQGGRPVTQTQIEDLINKGDFTGAQKVVDNLASNDPYKRSMQSVLDSVTTKSQDTENSVPSLEIKRAATKLNVDVPPKFSSSTEGTAYQQLVTNSDQYINTYENKFDTHVNADNAKQIFPEYNGTNAMEFDKVGGNLAKLVYNDLLVQHEGDTNKTVLFSAGGTGSGKSTAIKGLKQDYAIQFDSNLNNFDRAKQNIDNALSKGYQVDIRYVYRDPSQAFTQGVLKRYELGEPRTVPVDTHINAHINARDNILKLAEEYKNNPNVDIQFFDNSGKLEDIKNITLENVAQKTYNKAALRKELTDYANKLKEKGILSQEQATALTGSNGTEVRKQPEAGNKPRQPETKQTEKVKTPSGFASDEVNPYASLENRTKAATKRLNNINIIEMPELVKLARELSGNIPEVEKKLRGARGRFSADPKNPLIKLNAEIFKDPELAAKTLAHEMGHLIDFLPDKNMARGNLVGRIVSLNRHLKQLYGDLDNKTIKKELINLTQLWKPFDPQKDPKYTAYRQKPTELYADAISVLFNDPLLLQEVAPEFYSGFFEYLDNKPAVKAEFFDLQDLLNKGEQAILSDREESIRNMFKKGEDLFKIKVEEQKTKQKDYVFRLKYELIDQNQKVIDLVNKAKKLGKTVSDDDNPVYWLEGHNYVGGLVKNWVETSIQPIYKKLAAADVSWEDFGQILFLERVLNDRSKLANPLGFTPKTAGDQLNFIKNQLGEERYKLVSEELPKYREAIKKIMDSPGAKEFYNPELLQSIKDNPAYATYQVLDYFDTNLPASIKHQVGTLKEISNPATSTVVKTISIIRAIERNQTKGKIIKFLKNNFEKEIEPAKTIWNGKSHIPVDPKERGKALITVMEQGKFVGYYVDPYIAATMERMTVGHTNAVLETFKFFNQKAFRPLFITFNVGFQSFNAARDLMRTYKNLPTYNPLQVINEYRKAAPAAYARAFELPNKTIQEMEKSKILNITFNDLVAGETDEDKQIDSILNKYGLSPLETKKINKFIRPFEKVLDLIKRSGDFIETLPKVAGYNMLNGKLPNQELASFIRTSIGSPDFMRKGAGYRWYNEVFLFSNAIKEGIRADFNIAFKNPQTRSGFWWKSALINFLPKLLMFAAAIGLFGDKLKKMFDNVSEYDKTNYTIVPMSIDGGKTIYLRIPQDETGRLYGGLLWKVINSASNQQNISQNLTDLLATAGGQIPNISPLVTSLSAISQYLAGQNPYDFFHGQNVIPDTQFKAGGLYSLKPFLIWEAQNLGLGTIMKTYITEQAPTNKQWYQQVLDAPILSNILGRWLKVSDYGQREDNQKIQQQQQAQAAQKSIQQKELINDYLKEWQASDKSQVKKNELINRFSKQVTQAAAPEDKQRDGSLAKRKIKLALDLGEYGPNTDSLISSNSNDNKVKILQKVQDEMTTEEFLKYKSLLLREGIISDAVVIQLRKAK